MSCEVTLTCDMLLMLYVSIRSQRRVLAVAEPEASESEGKLLCQYRVQVYIANVKVTVKVMPVQVMQTSKRRQSSRSSSDQFIFK